MGKVRKVWATMIFLKWLAFLWHACRLLGENGNDAKAKVVQETLLKLVICYKRADMTTYS